MTRSAQRQPQRSASLGGGIIGCLAARELGAAFPGPEIVLIGPGPGIAAEVVALLNDSTSEKELLRCVS